MSTASLAGLRDKLYWRQAVAGGPWHCFKKLGGPRRGYVSLCLQWLIPRSGTQGCGRPPAPLRCAVCDGAEMKRRAVDESMPESRNWREFGIFSAKPL